MNNTAQILLVDDEETFCTVTANLLRLDGFSVEYRCIVEEALAFLEDHSNTDIVLLDIDLSDDISGVELLPKILEKHPFIQVIMLTSQQSLEIGIECMKKGAYDYLPKPYKREEFKRIFPGAIERKRLKQLSSLYLEILVHDLKNPLQALNMAMDMLCGDIPLNDEVKEKSVNLARFGFFQINSMISNILSVSKFEKASFPLEYTKFVLEEEILTEQKGLINRIEYTGKKFVLTLRTKKKYKLKTDKSLFFQILSNLLANAIRFSKKEDRISVTVEKKKKDFLEVRVANTGSFIELDRRELIFDKFYKSRFQNNSGGQNSGLGLTFCKMAVAALGGEIRVECDEKIPETAFCFTIPNQA